MRRSRLAGVGFRGVDDQPRAFIAEVSEGWSGGALLTETIRATGLDQALSPALAPWRRPLAQHDPGKILLELVLTLALGGDCVG